MKPQAITTDVLREKYAQPGEPNADAIRRRVAAALAAGESSPALWDERFLAAQRRGFIPAGRINAVAGTALQASQTATSASGWLGLLLAVAQGEGSPRPTVAAAQRSTRGKAEGAPGLTNGSSARHHD